MAVKISLPIFLALLFLMLPLQANQSGVVVRLAGVYAKANADSALIGQLAPGSEVSIFQRQGGWKEVFSESDELVGWVRSYQVREGVVVQQAGAEGGSDSRGFLAGLASFSRKASRFFSSSGSGTSANTATIGVRGLSEAEIESARPDFEEFARMKQYVSNDKRLTQFKSNGQLKAIQVKHIKSGKTQKKSGSGNEK